MPEEATKAPVDWVAKLAAEGLSVIRGGAPEETETPPETGTPPETPETPETGAPSETQTESPEIDWKQRYEDLRPEADRRANLLNDIEGRNGPERQAQALAEHARIELEEEEAEDDSEDEFDYRDPIEEVDKVRQELAERDQAAQEVELNQLEEQYCQQTIEELEGSEGFKLSDEEYDFVVNRALANRDQHDGKPDLEGSFKAFKKSFFARHGDIASGKADTAAPPVGTAGEPKINLRDKDARQKLGREVFEAAERAKQS